MGIVEPGFTAVNSTKLLTAAGPLSNSQTPYGVSKSTLKTYDGLTTVLGL